MGLAFWSELDSAGQESAPVFDSAQDAIKFLHGWPVEARPPSLMKDINFVNVVPDLNLDGGAKYASAQACMAAGLPGWITELSVDLHHQIYGERPSMH